MNLSNTLQGQVGRRGKFKTCFPSKRKRTEPQRFNAATSIIPEFSIFGLCSLISIRRVWNVGSIFFSLWEGFVSYWPLYTYSRPHHRTIHPATWAAIAQKKRVLSAEAKHAEEVWIQVTWPHVFLPLVYGAGGGWMRRGNAGANAVALITHPHTSIFKSELLNFVNDWYWSICFRHTLRKTTIEPSTKHPKLGQCIFTFLVVAVKQHYRYRKYSPFSGSKTQLFAFCDLPAQE